MLKLCRNYIKKDKSLRNYVFDTPQMVSEENFRHLNIKHEKTFPASPLNKS